MKRASRDAAFEALRKRAKRWLKAIRSGDEGALAELRRWLPGHSRAPGLREVQQALAREQGQPSWAALKEQLETRALDSAGLSAALLERACLSYTDDDWPSKWRRAGRILDLHPELARADLYTAAVSGEIASVRTLLSAKPALANRPGGPQRWPALLYVCYGRLPNPEAAQNALEIARLLLDAGADPNAQFTMEGGSRFTALTGAIGHGELGQPEHPDAEALARLLLERGARVDDGQALYNTCLEHDDPRWLELLFEYGLDASARINWHTGRGEAPKLLDFLVAQAATHGHLRRLRSLLSHGADPNSRSTYTGKTCVQAALMAGHAEIAELLLQHGARHEPLTGLDAFVAACARNDASEAERLLEGHREYLARAQPLIDAASAGKHATVELLLKLGMDPNGEGVHGHRALHVACERLPICELLLKHGADPRSRCFGGTVEGWARHAGNLEAARFHAAQSRSLIDAVSSGHVVLARELLDADPSCVNERSPNGDSALHELPDELERAEQLITLLVSRGADPSVKNKARQTPTQKLESRGLDQIADLLEAQLG